MFYAPLTVMFWQEAIGYASVIAFVGTQKEWENDKLSKLTCDSIRKWYPNTEIIFLKNDTKMPSYSLAQIIRIFIPVNYSNDFCITADIDLLPLNKDYFSVKDENKLHYFEPSLQGRPPKRQL